MFNIHRKIFKDHAFHLVCPSYGSLLAFSLLTLTTSGVLTMHGFSTSEYILPCALVCLIANIFLWFVHIISKFSYLGNHTLPVQRGLNMAVSLLLVSEVLLLLTFILCYFHSALLSSEVVAQWPQLGIEVIEVINNCELILFNTLITTLLLFLFIFITAFLRYDPACYFISLILTFFFFLFECRDPEFYKVMLVIVAYFSLSYTLTEINRNDKSNDKSLLYKIGELLIGMLHNFGFTITCIIVIVITAYCIIYSLLSYFNIEYSLCNLYIYLYIILSSWVPMLYISNIVLQVFIFKYLGISISIFDIDFSFTQIRESINLKYFILLLVFVTIGFFIKTFLVLISPKVLLDNIINILSGNGSNNNQTNPNDNSQLLGLCCYDNTKEDNVFFHRNLKEIEALSNAFNRLLNLESRDFDQADYILNSNLSFLIKQDLLKWGWTYDRKFNFNRIFNINNNSVMYKGRSISSAYYSRVIGEINNHYLTNSTYNLNKNSFLLAQLLDESGFSHQTYQLLSDNITTFFIENLAVLQWYALENAWLFDMKDYIYNNNLETKWLYDVFKVRQKYTYNKIDLDFYKKNPAKFLARRSIHPIPFIGDYSNDWQVYNELTDNSFYLSLALIEQELIVNYLFNSTLVNLELQGCMSDKSNPLALKLINDNIYFIIQSQRSNCKGLYNIFKTMMLDKYNSGLISDDFLIRMHSTRARNQWYLQNYKGTFNYYRGSYITRGPLAEWAAFNTFTSTRGFYTLMFIFNVEFNNMHALEDTSYENNFVNTSLYKEVIYSRKITYWDKSVKPRWSYVQAGEPGRPQFAAITKLTNKIK